MTDSVSPFDKQIANRNYMSPVGFKTRYGMVENPFSQGTTQGSGTLTVNANRYYRRVSVTNLM